MDKENSFLSEIQERESAYSFHKNIETFDTEDQVITKKKENFFDKLEKTFPNTISYFYLFSSAIFMIINAFCAKKLSKFPPFELLFLRSIVLMIFFFIYLSILSSENPNMIDKKNRNLILKQSLLTFILGYFYFYGIAEMPLSEAISILYCSPLFTGFILWIITASQISHREKLFSLIIFIGVLFVIRPKILFFWVKNNTNSSIYDENSRKIGGLMCLISALLQSINTVYFSLKKFEIHPLTLLFFGSLISSFLSFFFWIILEKIIFPYLFIDWLYIIFMSISNFFGYFFMIKGFLFNSKNIGLGAINYIQMIFAYPFDIFAFHDTPGFLSIFGSLFITFGCFLSVIFKK